MNSIFTDKCGRMIELDYDNFDTVAWHEGQEVGRLDFREVECDHYSYPQLMYASVEEKYQRAGIGVAMMRYAVEMHGKGFKKPDLNSVGGSHVPAENYYTEEGAALIRSCIRLGILDDNTQESCEVEDWDESDD